MLRDDSLSDDSIEDVFVSFNQLLEELEKASKKREQAEVNAYLENKTKEYYNYFIGRLDFFIVPFTRKKEVKEAFANFLDENKTLLTSLRSLEAALRNVSLSLGYPDFEEKYKQTLEQLSYDVSTSQLQNLFKKYFPIFETFFSEKQDEINDFSYRWYLYGLKEDARRQQLINHVMDQLAITDKNDYAHLRALFIRYIEDHHCLTTRYFYNYFDNSYPPSNFEEIIKRALYNIASSIKEVYTQEKSKNLLKQNKQALVDKILNEQFLHLERKLLQPIREHVLLQLEDDAHWILSIQEITSNYIQGMLKKITNMISQLHNTAQTNAKYCVQLQNKEEILQLIDEGRISRKDKDRSLRSIMREINKNPLTEQFFSHYLEPCNAFVKRVNNYLINQCVGYKRDSSYANIQYVGQFATKRQKLNSDDFSISAILRRSPNSP